MKQEDFIRRCQALIDQGTQLLATRRRPPPNVLSDDSIDSGGFYEWRASGLSFVRMVFGEEHPHFQLYKNSVKNPYFHDALQGMGF